MASIFLADQHALADVGYKALAVNLSDIAAMGAQATSALVTLSLPIAMRHKPRRLCTKGFSSVPRVSKSPSQGVIYRSTTARCRSAWSCTAWYRRSSVAQSGACEGDVVVLTGPVGGSLLGRHLKPTPRLDPSADSETSWDRVSCGHRHQRWTVARLGSAVCFKRRRCRTRLEPSAGTSRRTHSR